MTAAERHRDAVLKLERMRREQYAAMMQRIEREIADEEPMRCAACGLTTFHCTCGGEL
jgi:hypothetical protein